MSKKLYILIGLIIAITAAAAFILTREEDPLITQAKEEIRKADAALVSFQNVINAIPSLEFSQDVKNDFKIQANFLGLLGSVTGEEDNIPSPAAMNYGSKFISAAEARGSAKLVFDLEGGLEKPLKDAILIADVTREDLAILEKTANVFDEAVKQAKAGVPVLQPFTVERNKKTEKYFLEFERTGQKLKAAAASLDNYSSVDFRTKIKKLKSANEVFGEIAQYTSKLIIGKAGMYSLNVAKTFSEVVSEETAVKNCAKYDFQTAPAVCKPVAFLPGKFQPLLLKLAALYEGLIE